MAYSRQHTYVSFNARTAIIYVNVNLYDGATLIGTVSMYPIKLPVDSSGNVPYGPALDTFVSNVLVAVYNTRVLDEIKVIEANGGSVANAPTIYAITTAAETQDPNVIYANTGIPVLLVPFTSTTSSYAEGVGFDYASWTATTIEIQNPDASLVNDINTLGVGGIVTNLSNLVGPLQYSSFTISNIATSTVGPNNYLTLTVQESVTGTEFIHGLDIEIVSASTTMANRSVMIPLSPNATVLDYNVLRSNLPTPGSVSPGTYELDNGNIDGGDIIDIRGNTENAIPGGDSVYNIIWNYTSVPPSVKNAWPYIFETTGYNTNVSFVYIEHSPITINGSYGIGVFLYA